jgi:hypothetical protein
MKIPSLIPFVMAISAMNLTKSVIILDQLGMDADMQSDTSQKKMSRLLDQGDRNAVLLTEASLPVSPTPMIVMKISIDSAPTSRKTHLQDVSNPVKHYINMKNMQQRIANNNYGPLRGVGLIDPLSRKHIIENFNNKISEDPKTNEDRFDDAIRQAFGIPISSEISNFQVEPIIQEGKSPEFEKYEVLSLGGFDHKFPEFEIGPNYHEDNINSSDDETELGPFATIINELLKDSKDNVEKHYNEGSELEENDYHHKIQEPFRIVYRRPKPQKKKKASLKPTGNLAELLKFISSKPKRSPSPVFRKKYRTNNIIF